MARDRLGTSLTNVKGPDLLAHAISEVPYIRPDPDNLLERTQLSSPVILQLSLLRVTKYT